MNNEQIIICNDNIPKIGEIYWSTGVFDPIETLSSDSNTVIKKDRPVLVISKKQDNKNVRCVVLPLTSSSSCLFEGNKYKLPTRIDKDRDSYVILSQPMTVSFSNLRTKLAVIVSRTLMSDILKRFRSYFYLDDEDTDVNVDLNVDYEIDYYNKQQEEKFNSNNPFFAQVANISKQLAENREKEDKYPRNKHTSTSQQNVSDSEFIPTPDDIMTAKNIAKTFITRYGKNYDIVSGRTVLTLKYLLKKSKSKAQFCRDIGISYQQCFAKLLPMMRDKLAEMGLDLYK